MILTLAKLLLFILHLYKLLPNIPISFKGTQLHTLRTSTEGTFHYFKKLILNTIIIFSHSDEGLHYL